MTNRSGIGNSPQDDFDPLIVARLADVVGRLRRDWIAHMAIHWGDIHTIDEDARGELEQRVAITLREGFFSFGQLLCGFEVLLLNEQQVGLMLEESILGLEKLVVQLRDCQADLVKVSKADGGLRQVLRHRERGSGGTDH